MAFNTRSMPSKQDISAGFIVFLIALPLCVGISVASGVPPAAGLISAIVGGILGSALTGSKLTINGPAAGMIVVVLGCVEELGRGDPMQGYRAMLACVVLAGIFQALLGLFRCGKFGFSLPSTVVHGMMGAIGLIIIAKQAHVLLGVTPTSKTPLGQYRELLHSLTVLNPEIALIGLSALALMFFASKSKLPVLRTIPTPLLVVLGGVGLGYVFDLEHEHTVSSVVGVFNVGPKFLLNVPANFIAAFHTPDFTGILSWPYFKHALIMAFVASTESILSALAVDRMDPLKRESNMDKELMGKGICNILSGLLGGLPMIAEIVRSTANVSNKAQTQWSNFFHGTFLLAFLLFVPQYMHLIPIASLAAILIYVGFQLARPKHFFHASEKGKDQAVVFATTCIAILATDLLIGVLVGAVTEFAFVMLRGKSVRLFRVDAESHTNEDQMTLQVKSPLAFTNYLSLRSHLLTTTRVKGVRIDLRQAAFIDQTVMEHLDAYMQRSKGHGLSMDLIFSDSHQSVGKHPLAMKVLQPSSMVMPKPITVQAGSKTEWS